MRINKWLYLMSAMMMLVISSGGCGGSSSSSGGGSQAEPIDVSALEGTWRGTNGSGTGGNQKYLPGQTVHLTVEYVELSISNIRYSEETGTGTADVSFSGRIVNTQYNIDFERNQYSATLNMTNEGRNSWGFTAAYSDGNEDMTITLSSGDRGVFRDTGVMWNEDDTSDRTTYNFSCNISKQ